MLADYVPDPDEGIDASLPNWEGVSAEAIGVYVCIGMRACMCTCSCLFVYVCMCVFAQFLQFSTSLLCFFLISQAIASHMVLVILLILHRCCPWPTGSRSSQAHDWRPGTTMHLHVIRVLLTF